MKKLALLFLAVPLYAGVPRESVRDGQWGITRIIAEVEFDGTTSYTTAAMRQNLADVVEGYYPPLNDTKTAYLQDYALVRLLGTVGTPDADTLLLPSLSTRFQDLTARQRSDLIDNLSDRLTSYSFRDYDGTDRTKTDFSVTLQSRDNTTDMRQIVSDIYGHFHHSLSRQRAVVFESHNTEYTDNFSTDPFSDPRWTNVKNTQVWDSGNGELDMQTNASNRPSARYSQNGPGSIEHESQATFIQVGSFALGGGGATRFDNTGVLDWYYNIVDTNDNIVLYRVNGDSRSTLTTFSSALVNATNDFLTVRMASSGSAGSNVVLSLWYTNHGTSKPSDPGWIGVDASPNQTYTDTAADRLDDSVHSQCGIASEGGGIEVDTRHDFFKQRAISDRAGAAAPAPPKWNVIITE